jgi:glycosyltransferase involved in cell wall biosynthesis
VKIAMLGHKQIPGRSGGIEVVVEELSKRLVKLGHEVTCYNRSTRENNRPYTYEGINVIPVKTIDKKGLAAITSSYFATKKAMKSNCEVIHFHAEGPSIWTKMAKKHSKKKIIVTIHGLDWQRSKWGGIATRVIKKGEQNAAKYADEVIVLSKNVQDYFKKEYNRKTTFIPNGVSKPNIEKANIIKNKFGLNKDEYILFLGRMVPEKGIHYLIDAYNNIKTNKKLVLAGGASDTDSYYQELKEKAKGNKNIIFTGFVAGKELDELYSNAYIYVLPSDLEGMPLSLLEAMSYGNCCLTSDIKECATVIEDEGATFKKSNIDDLTKELQNLCDKKELVDKYKRTSQKFILDKYNWDDVVKETLKLYNK